MSAVSESMEKILKEPNDFLHKKCNPVTDFEDAKKIAHELLIVMKSVTKYWNRWLGFSANQIGYKKRIIALRNGKDQYEIFVNPILLEHKFPFCYFERCYSSQSLKEIYLVKRYLWSKVKYQDINSAWHEKIIRGPSAIYHEIDHINGIMVSEIGQRIL